MAQAALKERADLAPYEASSPTLLASEPATVPQKPDDVDRDWPMLRQHCEQQISSMRNWRYSWWDGIWNGIARFIEPVRSTWVTQTPGGYPSPNNQSRGRDLNRDILDPCATYAVRVGAAGLMNGIASPSRPWLKLKPMGGGDAPADGSAWIDEVEQRMLVVMATSNFYDSFFLECTDALTFGTAPALIYEDAQDIIRLYNPCNGEYYLAVDSTFRVNTFARAFVLTVEQIVAMFGLKNCPREIQELWEQKGASLQQERSIGHIIEPNFALSEGEREYGVVKGPFTWREVYWLYGAGTSRPFSIRGFREQPYTVTRWMIQGNDPYGRSPAMDALGDVKTLQVLQKRLQQALEKVVNPPLLADISLKNEPASTLPGGVTYVNQLGPDKGMRSIYQINPDIPGMTAQIQDVRDRIKKGFFNDLFLMLSGEAGGPPQRTAYEVAQIMQEKLQVLGPVIEGMLAGMKQKVKRIYRIMDRRGMLPPKPDSMKNVQLDIEFVSILALAQKAAATGGIERLVGLAGHIIAAYPQSADVIDPDETLREYNDLLGNPEKLMRTPEVVEQMREQKAQQQAAQQRLQMIAQGGQAAVQAANTLSQTPMNTGSALDALLGRGQPPQ